MGERSQENLWYGTMMREWGPFPSIVAAGTAVQGFPLDPPLNQREYPERAQTGGDVLLRAVLALQKLDGKVQRVPHNLSPFPLFSPHY